MREMQNNNVILPKKVWSVSELQSNTNYEDICGPWKFDNVPLRKQYNYLSSILHISKLITPEDMSYMRKQQMKEPILVYLEEKIRSIPCEGRNQEILIKLLWQTFKFFKEKLFADKKISMIFELMLSTHCFYLSNYWNTAEETYKFFFERVLSCTVTDPPKCREIFTPYEAGMILDFFHEIYLENIILLHLVYMSHYRIVIQLGD